MKRIEIFFGLLRIPLDFLMAFFGFILGHQLRLLGDFIPGRSYYLNPEIFPPLQEFTGLALFFALLWVLTLFFFGHYRLKSPHGPFRELGKILEAGSIWALLLMSYFFLIHEIFFSRLVLVFGIVLSLVFTMIGRIAIQLLQKKLMQWGYGRRGVLFIGGKEITEKLGVAFKKDPRYEVIGFLDSEKHKIHSIPYLGNFTEFAQIVEKYGIDEVIVTEQKISEIQEQDILDYCLTHHLEYHFVPDILEVERSNVEITPVAGFPLIHLKSTPLEGWGKVLKRGLDIVGSIFGFIILSPMLLTVAIGIKLDSKGPILFSRLDDDSPALRVGQFGKTFQFFKFRTMRANSHEQRYTELADKNYRQGPLVKIKNDPRITRFGAFLRRWDLDEWPQLWNVLKGDMSLVGPRPHLPEEVARYEDRHRFLFTIKPGITGLAQVSGRSDLDFEEEARLDSSYIREWSLFWDLKIILKTIGVILGRHKEN